MGKKFLIIFRKEVFEEPLLVAKQIQEKTGGEVVIYTPEELKENLEKLKGDLKLKAEIFTSDEAPEEIIEKEKPFLVILPRKRIAPLIHAFKKYWSEKLIEDSEKYNFLLVEQGFSEIKRVLLYVDRDKASERYIKTIYEFFKTLEVDFEFTTVFDERYFALLIKKEHPEMEAKQILEEMVEEYIKAVRKKLKETLHLEKVDIVPLKGEIQKALPFYAKLHRYDLLVISHAYDTKEELIENSETSVAVFEN